MAQFKYFFDPEKYACILDGERECDICHQRKKCFDGKAYHVRSRILKDIFEERKRRFPDPKKMKTKELIEFYRVRLAGKKEEIVREQREKPKAFCFECVAKGRLFEVGASVVEGDVQALRKQIQRQNPSLSTTENENKVQERTKQLEGSTPAFAPWQDWLWAAHCGDYCQLITLAGQDEFNKLAVDGDGKKLFRNSLHGDLKEHTDVDSVWSRLKPDSRGPRDKWSPLAYIFKCLSCGAILTIWDSR